eukprot:6203725-Pleurochrysis_carterae.AAC.1
MKVQGCFRKVKQGGGASMRRRAGLWTHYGYGAKAKRFLDGMLDVASPDTLLPRSRYLLQCLASIIAASGGGDYGRASDECNVW